MIETPRVAVVGGGAVGVTAAHDLASRGADVTLHERDDVASGASGRAAGIAYDAVAEDVDAAVADRALDRFHDLDAAGAIEFTRCPYLWLAREGDDRSARAIREQVERMRASDREVSLLDADGVAERFPALSLDVAVAAVAENAGHLSPSSYVRAMADRTEAAGARIETGAAVALDLSGDRPAILAGDAREAVDAVVVAAGAHTPRLLADAGRPIPVKPYRVQALTTDPLDVVADPGVPMTYDATGGYYLRPRKGGLLVGDGTEEREFDPDEYDREADPWFVDDSRERVRRALGVDPTVDRAWAGLCTATPDRDPLVGPLTDDREVFVATGWHGHGFMRSPALGEAVADLALGGDGTAGLAAGVSLDPFDPRRFDGDEQFEVVEGMRVD